MLAQPIITRSPREPYDANLAPVSGTVSVATWARADWLALAAVVLTAAVLRFSDLAHPPAFVFDETYYVPAACRLALGPRPECNGPFPYDLHPPLGKWLIAAGIALAGFTPVGWRIAAAAAGTLTVGLLFVTARRLLGSTISATVAAGLLALDLLHFVHSRIGMLDAFLVLFAVAALMFWTLDRESARVNGQPHKWTYGLFQRPWRIATGLAAGAAIATKWPGAAVAATAIALTLLADIPRTLRSAGGRGPRVHWAHEAASVATWLVALPLCVYALAHAWTMRGALLTWPWAEGAWVRALIAEQLRLLRLHPTVANAHPLQNAPWLWLFSPRPLPYFVGYFGETSFGMILALGNPAWAPAMLALAVVAARLVRTPRASSTEAALVIAFVLSYLPWFAIARVRAVFLFHFLPTVPILYLIVAAALTPLPHRRASRAGLVALAAAVAVTFALLHPILTAAPFSYATCCRSVATLLMRNLPDCTMVTLLRLPPRERADPC